MAELNRNIVLTKLEWGVVFALLSSAGSIIFSAGIVWQAVQQNSAEISTLKTSRDDSIDRLARIETKLDLVLGGNQEILREN
ncbi:hypothetical protein [Altericroceibacterium endophyticum]|uniref:Uncharacterized protein n=1 Tax=Altericroceibacterium endophyticum TaxID=1808508 RepID=A0A6I4T6F0_9SPHN|nr:hypothetical protein [Altericroceibacterium endophyticum]MXO66248.1 hypothetical protein [Altericroceibacterium endophyticum]